jgi:hypothetical protein
MQHAFLVLGYCDEEIDWFLVCTSRDAVECFWTSPLDAFVIGSDLIEELCR